VSKDRLQNVAASVRARLANVARQQGEDFQLVLTRYVIERLLYRLSESAYGPEFVLKGAVLFRLWTGELHRPTRDLDLLGKGDHSLEHLGAAFRAVCTQPVEDDGVVFRPEDVRAERIKEDQDYEGVRVHCTARVGQARIDLHVDVGFGDVVTPQAERVEFPVILDFPAPILRAYPRETAVAEKFQAMVALGIANSRMKDFYDLWVLAKGFPFDGATLSQAIRATFRRRKTALPAEPPLALTAEFGTDAGKVTQWQAFVRKSKLDVSGASLKEVCAFLNGFLMPPAQASAAGAAFGKRWMQGGPWMDQTAEQA
jgi:predicted nucleotidyltransferase component of viral defense system